MGGCVLAFPVFWSQFEVLIVCMVFDAICIVSIYLISLSYHIYVCICFAFVCICQALTLKSYRVVSILNSCR